MDRFDWAIKTMQIVPSDIILEVGCGTGMALAAIISQLKKGHLTAIDRSAAQIAKAAKKHQSLTDSDKLKLLTGDFLEARLPPSSFSLLFSVNVSDFWKDKKTILHAHALLQSRGRLYIFHQPPPGSSKQKNDDMLAGAALLLSENGFSIQNTLQAPLSPPVAAIYAVKV